MTGFRFIPAKIKDAGNAITSDRGHGDLWMPRATLRAVALEAS